MKKRTSKTAVFLWEGNTKQGVKTKGEIEANNLSLAKATLRKQGIKPTKVRKKPQPLFGKRKQKIKAADIAIFSRQMSTMLNSGIPLIQSFEIVARGLTNPSMSELVHKVKTDVEAGNSLGESLSKHPLHFDNLYCSLVFAGEQSGALETLLSSIATYKEKTESIKSKIKKALFYPVTVLFVAFFVTALMLIFVVPQFQEVFEGFGAELPAFTQMIIHLSDFFQSYWYIVFGGFSGAVWCFLQAQRRSQRFAHLVDRLKLKLPVVGDILRNASIARFARTLAIMFAAGLPIVDALKSVAGATGNILYSNATLQMRDEISTGQQMQIAMRHTNMFPTMVVQMIAIGEEAGSLELMLSKVADHFEEQVDNTVDNLSSLLEPMIMIVLGVLVGGLIVGMYLPIFQLGSVI